MSAGIAAPVAETLPMSPREVSGVSTFYGVLGPDGSSQASNMAYAVKINGDIDLARLRQAIERIFAEHPELRAFYSADGQPPAKFLANEPAPFTYVDCAHNRGAFRRTVEAAVQSDLVLWRYPLVRLTLVRHSEKRWVLVIVGHHLLMDGWSFMLLLRMLSEYYAGLLHGEERHFAAGCGAASYLEQLHRARASPECAELRRELVEWMSPAAETLRRTRDFVFPPEYEKHGIVRLAPVVVSRLQEAYGRHPTMPHRMLLVLLELWLTGSNEAAFTESHPNRGEDAGRKLFSRSATSTTRPAADEEGTAWRLFGMLSDDLLIRVPVEPADTVQDLGEKLFMSCVYARDHAQVPASFVLTELFDNRMLQRFHFNPLSPGFHALRLEGCRVTHLKLQPTLALAEVTLMSISAGRLLLAVDSPTVEGHRFEALERALHVFAQGLLSPQMPVSELLEAAHKA